MKKYIPLIFTIFSFIVLVGLGTWQVQRLQWKTALIQQITTRMAEKPITLADFKSPEEDEYRQVTLTGTFDNSKTMEIIGRPFNGKPGIYVITPMQTEKGVVLVNRGWSKYEEKYSSPEGMQKVTGIIRKNQVRNFIGRHVTMDNVPEKNMWFYADLPQMYGHIKAPNQNFYVELTDNTTPNSYPYALPKEITLYNEHLSYAITWYSLAIALILIYYFRFHRR